MSNSSQAEDFYQRARREMRIGGLKSDALRYLNAAIEADPNFADAYDARSNVLISLDRIDEALADLKRCASLGGPTRDNAIE